MQAVALISTILLLAGNAFFVAAEFALVSARRSRIELEAAAGSRAAAVTLRAMERVSLMMAGAQLGITICSLGLGALSEPAIASLLTGPLGGLGLPHDAIHPIAFAIALSLVTFAHVVLGEMVPKNLTLAAPDRAALLLGRPLTMVVRVLRPLVAGLNATANAVLRALRVQPRDEVASVFTREEVAVLIEESRSGGLLDPQDGKLVLDALTFEDREARSIVVPRAQLRTLPPDATPEQMERAAVESGFSRFPIAEADGALIGYVHVKDLLETDPARRAAPMSRATIRPLPAVRESDSLLSIVETMRRTGAHLAAVTGPDGAPIGVAMLEDTVEELVGRIRG
jgi:CBS domain containing-hemolysin-like protein